MGSVKVSPVLKDIASELPAVCTTADLEKLLKIDASSWATWRYEGKGPEFLKLGGAVRYTRQAVLAWLSQQVTGGDVV